MLFWAASLTDGFTCHLDESTICRIINRGLRALTILPESLLLKDQMIILSVTNLLTVITDPDTHLITGNLCPSPPKVLHGYLPTFGLLHNSCILDANRTQPSAPPPSRLPSPTHTSSQKSLREDLRRDMAKARCPSAEHIPRSERTSGNESGEPKATVCQR